MFLLALAAAAALAAPQIPLIPPATLDDTLEVTGELLDARQVRTRMFVDVRVNGQGPYRFLVDSGADRSVIGSALAARLALPAGRAVTLRGMAGSATVGTVVIDTIALGTSEISGIVAPALAETNLGAQGLIGIDALADQRLMLDFDRKTVTVQDSRRPASPVADEIVVTARRRKGQLILTEVEVARSRIFGVIDTGSEVTLGNSALLARISGRGRLPPSQPITLISVTGQTIVADLYRLPLMRIGKITLTNVPVAFADVPPFALFGLDRQPALLIGTDVLEAFRRVSLDFRNRKVRFVLRR